GWLLMIASILVRIGSVVPFDAFDCVPQRFDLVRAFIRISICDTRWIGDVHRRRLISASCRCVSAVPARTRPQTMRDACAIGSGTKAQFIRNTCGLRLHRASEHALEAFLFAASDGSLTRQRDAPREGLDKECS